MNMMPDISQAEINYAEAERARLRRMTAATATISRGSTRLHVYGEHEAIQTLEAILKRNTQMQGVLARLAAAAQAAGQEDIAQEALDFLDS